MQWVPVRRDGSTPRFALGVDPEPVEGSTELAEVRRRTRKTLRACRPQSSLLSPYRWSERDDLRIWRPVPSHSLGPVTKNSLGVSLKGPLAARRAEIVSGPLIGRGSRGLPFIHGHAADWINRHRVHTETVRGKGVDRPLGVRERPRVRRP